MTVNFNQGVLNIGEFVLDKPLTLDPATLVTIPPPPSQIGTIMTVANGTTVLVYDITDPTHPVLIRTIG